MNKIAFVTDSSCGQTNETLQQFDLFSVPLQISVDGKTYKENQDFSADDLIHALRMNRTITTSLPALSDIEALFSHLKEQGYTEIFAIPICTGLSGTISAMYSMAAALDLEFNYFDSGSTAAIQFYLCQVATTLYHQGHRIPEIQLVLQEIAQHSNTILIPDNLFHLAKSGRLSAASAMIGNFIKIKPILAVNLATSGRIEVVQKIRTFKRALRYVLDDMLSSLGHEANQYCIYVGHAGAQGLGESVVTLIQEKYPQFKTSLINLVPTVSAHTGLGCIGIQYYRVYSLST